MAPHLASRVSLLVLFLGSAAAGHSASRVLADAAAPGPLADAVTAAHFTAACPSNQVWCRALGKCLYREPYHGDQCCTTCSKQPDAGLVCSANHRCICKSGAAPCFGSCNRKRNLPDFAPCCDASECKSRKCSLLNPDALYASKVCGCSAGEYCPSYNPGGIGNTSVSCLPRAASLADGTGCCYDSQCASRSCVVRPDTFFLEEFKSCACRNGATWCTSANEGRGACVAPRSLPQSSACCEDGNCGSGKCITVTEGSSTKKVCACNNGGFFCKNIAAARISGVKVNGCLPLNKTVLPGGAGCCADTQCTTGSCVRRPNSQNQKYKACLCAPGSAWCQTSAPPLFGQGKCLKKGMTAQLRACCKDDDCRSGKCLTITNYQTGKKARICDCIEGLEFCPNVRRSQYLGACLNPRKGRKFESGEGCCSNSNCKSRRCVASPTETDTGYRTCAPAKCRPGTKFCKQTGQCISPRSVEEKGSCCQNSDCFSGKCVSVKGWSGQTIKICACKRGEFCANWRTEQCRRPELILSCGRCLAPGSKLAAGEACCKSSQCSSGVCKALANPPPFALPGWKACT
ncbi:hypothetical protein D9Q98_004588 [Chlorella vulgaris]|uniref:Uncharacterized protein n=1 Tax=Chlorella vulgaris TaxID=3077 RepID=A0A9D4YXK6_CHLVU|nr:hypothetical protein D9Q98_004588 [Chlorella vulgaris]